MYILKKIKELSEKRDQKRRSKLFDKIVRTETTGKEKARYNAMIKEIEKEDRKVLRIEKARERALIRKDKKDLRRFERLANKEL